MSAERWPPEVELLARQLERFELALSAAPMCDPTLRASWEQRAKALAIRLEAAKVASLERDGLAGVPEGRG